jgi:adhesin transport system outer membrane protein
MGQCTKRALGVSALAFTLAGCLSDVGGGVGAGISDLGKTIGASDFVTRLKSPDLTSTDRVKAAKPSHSDKINAESDIIKGLTRRTSVLPQGSTFDQVGTAVLAANSRSAEAELRSARLRSEAASKNWLPKIGPQISLTSLGSVVANLVVDQVLFDNGGKKGEREFAVADVEVAAVNLAQDTNDRVHTALDLYTTGAEAREKSILAQATFKDMGHFEWIMSERVRGGVSDRSDLNILRQKLGEIKADQARDLELERTSVAELNAMSARSLGDLRGVPSFRVPPSAAQPLSVTLAVAQMTRSVAQAKMDRAGQLPGLSAGGTVGDGTNIGLHVKTDTLLGFGTGASLRAIEAAKEAAGRRVGQANEDSNRQLRKLESQIAAKARQAKEAVGLTRQAKANLDVFQRQYDAGQRQVMDVVGVYETFARQQQTQVSLKYDVVRLRLEMARILGVLADGTEI